jgi:hydroxypyruvate reductase
MTGVRARILRQTSPRDLLLTCFRAALAAVDARRSVAASLRDGPLPGDWHLIAAGKAAGAMALGALDVLAARIVGGRVVVPAGHWPPGFPRDASALQVLESAHPVPDQRSLDAGEELLDYVARLPRAAQVLCLVSGGASSLVEASVPGLGLRDLQRFNRWALASGLPISSINALRRRVSRLKGGALGAALGARRVVAMFVSDVPGDDPCTIGSGLLHADADHADFELERKVIPEEIAEIPGRAAVQSVVPRAGRIPVRMVATLRQAREAAAKAARARGFEVKVARSRYSGEAAELGARFARAIGRAPARTVLVWGGESTVCLPERPGRGGRNQHLALSAALALERAGDGWLLAAGTDGVDGVSDDAGALVDARTCERGRDAGFDPHVSLAAADSGSFLEASGDLLHTGPTLTNVGDLVLAVRWGGER